MRSKKYMLKSNIHMCSSAVKKLFGLVGFLSFSLTVFCQSDLEIESDQPRLTFKRSSTEFSLVNLSNSFLLQEGLVYKIGLFNSFEFGPSINNNISLGSNLFRWKEIWSNNGLNMTSDRRLKKNISTIPYGLETIRKLRPVSFQWKEEDSNVRLGFIAQDMEEVIPEIVQHYVMNEAEIERVNAQGRSGYEKDIYSMNYISLILVLVRAVSELAEENDRLKKQIIRLEEVLSARN